MFISSFYKLRSGYWDDLIPVVQAIIVTAAHQLSMKTKYLFTPLRNARKAGNNTFSLNT